MRGTDGRHRHRPAGRRFIPAHAGNSLAGSDCPLDWPVHPRACGEQGARHATGAAPGGSSPRMRGTGLDRLDLRTEIRFIPAHAGNRPSCGPLGGFLSVHPRACGEQADLGRVAGLAVGSSPRMRGTAGAMEMKRITERFIPAHAGNRSGCVATITPLAVHPRACGEQPVAMASTVRTGGSSPRMRGTASRTSIFCEWRRFIPAHAGNSPGSEGRGDPRAVHPRACGEQSPLCQISQIPAGSSPRMRGTGTYCRTEMSR